MSSTIVGPYRIVSIAQSFLRAATHQSLSTTSSPMVSTQSWVLKSERKRRFGLLVLVVRKVVPFTRSLILNMGLYAGASCLCLYLLGSQLDDLHAMTKQAIHQRNLSSLPRAVQLYPPTREPECSSYLVSIHDEPTVLDRIKPSRDICAKTRVHSRALTLRENVFHNMSIVVAGVPLSWVFQ